MLASFLYLDLLPARPGRSSGKNWKPIDRGGISSWLTRPGTGSFTENRKERTSLTSTTSPALCCRDI